MSRPEGFNERGDGWRLVACHGAIRGVIHDIVDVDLGDADSDPVRAAHNLAILTTVAEAAYRRLAQCQWQHPGKVGVPAQKYRDPLTGQPRRLRTENGWLLSDSGRFLDSDLTQSMPYSSSVFLVYRPEESEPVFVRSGTKDGYTYARDVTLEDLAQADQLEVGEIVNALNALG